MTGADTAGGGDRGGSPATPGRRPAELGGQAGEAASRGDEASQGGGAAGGADGTGQRADALSYEQARDELAAVVRRLEAGGLTLEQSLECWERGEQLAARCAELLEGARARLSAAMAERPGDAGGPETPDAPF
jgi:exodeoxyribonuclease VII small subunit